MRRILAFSILSVLMLFVTGCDFGNTSEKNSASSASTGTDMPSCCDLSTTKDGTWTAESSTHKLLGKSVISLTIQDHKITKVVFTGYTIDGRIKAEDYGQDEQSSGLMKKAQLAVKAMKSYAAQLQEYQELSKVDAVTGATVSYQQFNEAARKAIEKAK